MIVKIKKRDLIILMVILLLIPLVYSAAVSQTFYVLVSMTNRGPIITYVNVSNVTPIGGNIVTIDIGFNVSDEDGFSDLDDSSAIINISYNGVVRSSSCSASSQAENYSFYICTVTFYYFDNASLDWNINVSIADNSANSTYNNTFSLSVLQLSSMRIETNLTFSGVSLGTQNKAAVEAIILNNTGNLDFGEINITGYDLTGMTDSTYFIGVGNFSVNESGDAGGAGTVLVNKTAVTIGSATLPHKLALSDTRGNKSLYFWLDVPSTPEITVQNYNSTTLWVVTVNST